MFSSVKYISIAAIVLAVLGALWYVTGLRANLAQSEANVKMLEQAVAQQSITINNIQAEQAQIASANASLRNTVAEQSTEIDRLRGIFDVTANGSERDFERTAYRAPGPVQRIINNGTNNATRCLEIASGSPLTEEELNATTKSTINSECPRLANPNYVPD